MVFKKSKKRLSSLPVADLLGVVVSWCSDTHGGCEEENDIEKDTYDEKEVEDILGGTFFLTTVQNWTNDEKDGPNDGKDKLGEKGRVHDDSSCGNSMETKIMREPLLEFLSIHTILSLKSVNNYFSQTSIRNNFAWISNLIFGICNLDGYFLWVNEKKILPKAL